MAFEIVQRSDAPNDAWRNLEFHYRAKGTREILRLSHEINGKTMEPGSDPFKFMMEVDRLAADLHRLGDKSVTKLRKYVIIVSGLTADFEMECRILENNPAGLNRAEIERVVGNQSLIPLKSGSEASSGTRPDSAAAYRSRSSLTQEPGGGGYTSLVSQSPFRPTCGEGDQSSAQRENDFSKRPTPETTEFPQWR